MEGQLLKGPVVCDKGFQLILQRLDVTGRFQARRVMIRSVLRKIILPSVGENLLEWRQKNRALRLGSTSRAARRIWSGLISWQ